MTTFHKVVIIVCRLFALYLAMACLRNVAWTLNMLATFPSPWERSLVLVSCLVPLIIAAVLWMIAPWIARRVLADVKDDQTPPSMFSLRETQVIAFAVAGLVLMVRSLPRIVVIVLQYLRTTGLDTWPVADYYSCAETVEGMLINLIEIGFGAWLFFGARHFARLFDRFNPPEAD